MTRGRIVVDRVSRTFRVYPKAQRTIKDLFVTRGRSGAREVRALRDVSLSVEPGEAVGLVGRNGSGQDDAAAPVSGIIKPTAGQVEAGGRIALAARARRRLPPRLHRPRERLPERVDPRAVACTRSRGDGRDRRLRRARALHRPPGPHLLVGHVHAARLLGRRAHRGRRAPARRGVRGRRRAVPAQVLRQGRRVQESRRHDPVRLARRAGRRAALRPGGAAAPG